MPSWVGGYLADVQLGKFKTIVYLSLAYVVGATLLSISAMPNATANPAVYSGIALCIVALGTRFCSLAEQTIPAEIFSPRNGRH